MSWFWYIVNFIVTTVMSAVMFIGGTKILFGILPPRRRAIIPIIGYGLALTILNILVFDTDISFFKHSLFAFAVEPLVFLFFLFAYDCGIKQKIKASITGILLLISIDFITSLFYSELLREQEVVSYAFRTSLLWHGCLLAVLCLAAIYLIKKCAKYVLKPISAFIDRHSGIVYGLAVWTVLSRTVFLLEMACARILPESCARITKKH